MSFRTRLTSFFALGMVVPVAAVGVLVFRLIANGQQGRADARAGGIVSTAQATYAIAGGSADVMARSVARTLARTSPAQMQSRLSALVSQGGLARVTITAGSTRLGVAGTPDAVAPGVASVPGNATRPPWTVTVSELTAQQFAQELSGPGVAVEVRQNGRTLASTLAGRSDRQLVTNGRVSLGGVTYGAATISLDGIGPGRLQVTALSDLSATAGSEGIDRVLAALCIATCLGLIVCFSLLMSRALDRRLASLLAAARRLRSGDLSATMPTGGDDEFAALSQEFNTISTQLADRLDDLDHERARVRQSIRRIGEAFAANLDREGILELALKTAMDATGSSCGRVSGREHRVEPLTEVIRFGSLANLGGAVDQSERRALHHGGIGEYSADDRYLATVALGAIVPGGPTHGLITICRSSRAFGDDERELLHSLAARATLALANVTLHFDIRRRAVTDDLSGLATHGHFQELLAAEMAEARRYLYSVGLIMLDIDDFKSINDLYGHQQGDVVLRHVGDVLRQNSRHPDVAARYGGDELALILPHTDLEGTFTIAERIRASIEQLQVPLLDGVGALRITASLGAAAACAGAGNDLIAAADEALYVAKREGKNKTVRAQVQSANVVGGE